MRYRSSFAWLLCLLFLPAGQALAVIQWQVESMSAPGFAARDVSATIAPADAGGLAVAMDIAAADFSALGLEGVKVRCQGDLRRPSARRWQFHGTLQIQGAPGGAFRSADIQLELAHDQNTLTLSLKQDPQAVQVAWPLDDLGHMQIHLAAVPVKWLQGLVGQIWEQGRMGRGQLSARLSVDTDEDTLRSAGRYRVQEIGFDSSDGALAGASIESQGHWSMTSRAGSTSLTLDARLQGGELLLGPLYANFPENPARLRVDATFADSAVDVKQLHFDDGSSLRFDGGFAFDADGDLYRVRVDGLRAMLPGAYAHYGKTLLAGLGFPNLTMEGMLTASGLWSGAGWQRFNVVADGLSIADPAQRIGLQALTGKLDWARDQARDPGRLSWNGLSIFGLRMGAAETHWQSSNGLLQLTRPARIPMLGGTVVLSQLDWAPAASDDEDRVAASIAYSGIDLAALSTNFGWPAFEGTVGGAIPELDYDGTRLRLGGGVSVNVFDGFVDVTQLVLQEPFSAAPVLEATVDFHHLDLEPMTEVFDFGSITGHLHGQISGLRMISWRPVAFSAQLMADEGGKISQKAVNSISSLGGSGLAGGLQSAVLGMFDNFGYDRIGLSCVLQDDVCTMSGLGETKDGGYTIVEGSGLPRISVVGHQHRVDWTTLLLRLKAATSGGDIKIE